MGNSSGWMDSPARGLSGGLITIWNKEILTVTRIVFAENCILILRKCLISSVSFACLHIYAPQNAKAKFILWESLGNILSSIVEPNICVLGDFHAVRSRDEKKNCKHDKAVMDAFNSFIKGNSFLDVPMVNYLHTWYGPALKKGRLDRVLLSAEWFDIGHWIIQTLQRKLSNHKPMILINSTQQWGPRPFNYFNCWVKEKNLLPSLKSAQNKNAS